MSLFFTIPKIRVGHTFFSISKKPQIDFGKSMPIALVCDTLAQSRFVVEKILAGRKVAAYVNIDHNVDPPSLALFLDVWDKNGFSLTVKDHLIIDQISGNLRQQVDFFDDQRIVFGCGADFRKGLLIQLLENREAVGHFSFTVGYDYDPEGGGMALPPTAWSATWPQEFTIYPYEQFLDNLLKLIKAG